MLSHVGIKLVVTRDGAVLVGFAQAQKKGWQTQRLTAMSHEDSELQREACVDGPLPTSGSMI